MIGSPLAILFMPESAFGPTKPTIVLQPFWGQYDNAQRMHELGLGIRLDTYVPDSGCRATVADSGPSWSRGRATTAAPPNCPGVKESKHPVRLRAAHCR